MQRRLDVYEEAASLAGVPAEMRPALIEKAHQEVGSRVVSLIANNMHDALMEERCGSHLAQDGAGTDLAPRRPFASSPR